MRIFALAITLTALGVNAAPQLNAVPTPAADLVQPYYENYTTPVAILSQYDSNAPDGSFNFSYDAANGIRQDTSGFFKKVYYPIFLPNGTATNETREENVFVQVGSYSYYDPNGELVSISYIADENGFHATGDRIPTPPPIPEDILVSLAESAKSRNYTNEYLAQNGFTDTFESFTVSPVPSSSTTVATTTTAAASTTAAAAVSSSSTSAAILSSSTAANISSSSSAATTTGDAVSPASSTTSA